MKSVVLLFLCVSAVVGISKRSSRWDAHLNHLHSKRQGQCNWQSGKDTECTLQGVMASDALDRRDPGVLAPVDSQGSCGSCWAFAAAHTYTDSRTIKARKDGVQQPPLLAAQYPASCLRNTALVDGGNGCCGGLTCAGFSYFKKEGAVTETCAPYDSLLKFYTYDRTAGAYNPPIDHTCPTSCADGSSFSPGDHRLYDFRVLTTEAEVMGALADGTVAAQLQASESFRKLYRCGIFCQEVNDKLIKGGYHSVEIVDYGTEDGVNFWVVKNSWGTDWGEDGYFRVRRGDLNMGPYIAPVLSSSPTTAPPVCSTAINRFTCSPIEVANPSNDTLVISAVDHTVDEINELDAIPCPDGSNASSIALSSIKEATTQMVDGTVIITEITVDILGCGGVACADVESTVVLLDNNTFDLTNYTYEYIYNSGSSALAGCVAMVMVAVATAILLL